MMDPMFPDGWLMKLAVEMKAPFNFSASSIDRLVGGPDKTQCYTSGRRFAILLEVFKFMRRLALYFTMSCMSTVGFGNIASNTLLEKIFAICMMIISALLYAAIFGHMTTIIQQMTASTVRYVANASTTVLAAFDAQN